MRSFGRWLRQLTVGAEKLKKPSPKSVHSTVIGNAQWRGADADRFRSEWNGVSARVLSGAAELLKNLSKELRRNADEQESASSYGPHGAAELLSHVENDRVDDQGNELESKESGDGLRIERVLGPDGQTRAIVYFKGQDSVDQGDSVDPPGWRRVRLESTTLLSGRSTRNWRSSRAARTPK